jgi:hypothetical protein
MSKWVTKEEAKRFDLWHSTKERRLVTIASDSPLEVIPIGEYRVPFIRKFDSLAFVRMGPKQVEVSLRGNAGTSDGIAIDGKISVQVIIRDEESCIRRIAADADEEERLLSDAILSAVQETIASNTWHQMMSIGEKFAQYAEHKLSELLSKTNSCFAVKGLTIQEIHPQNKVLAESLENAATAKEEEKLQKELVQLKVERIALERKYKEEELKSELQMQKLQHQRELQAEREKIKLQEERANAQISTQKKLSEILKTDEGRIAAFPERMFEILIKELDVKISDNTEREKLLREFIKAYQSFQAVQYKAMRVFVAQNFGVRFSEEPPMLPEEEKDIKQINDESKDNDNTLEPNEE